MTCPTCKHISESTICSHCSNIDAEIYQNHIQIVITRFANPSVIEYAQDLLERAKSGDIVGLTAIEEYQGGEYAIKGSTCLSRTQTAGILLDAALSRLNGSRSSKHEEELDK